jgi:PDZ domain
MAPARAHIAVAAVAGLALGLGAGAALRGALGGGPAPAPGPAAPPPDWSRALASLRAEISAERDARRSLEAEVDLLRQALGDVAQEEAPARDAGGRGGAKPGGTGAAPASARAAGGFAEDQLVARGLPAPEASRLRERYEQQELAELELRNRAMREGWLGRPRYDMELRALRERLRAEVGDEDYDRMLWAAGRSNRVAVAGVLSGSPAEAAGLEVGDVVISYGGHSIFDGGELIHATVRAEPGGHSRLVVLRNGEETSFDVPNGALGMRLKPERQAPDMIR